MIFEVDGREFVTEPIVLADLPRAIYYCWALPGQAPEEAYRWAVLNYRERLGGWPMVIYEQRDWSGSRMLYMPPPGEPARS